MFLQKMANYTTTTIIGWETRNLNKTRKAQVWGKNYGLRLILKNLLIGKLYAKEKSVTCKFFESLFSGKTDVFFVASLCNSCHTNLAPMVKEKAESLPDFEIITEK